MAVSAQGIVDPSVASLLEAGANVKAVHSAGKTAFDYARENQKLRGTAVYRRLEEGDRTKNL